jgi:hypothetical protein
MAKFPDFINPRISLALCFSNSAYGIFLMSFLGDLDGEEAAPCLSGEPALTPFFCGFF